MRDTALYEEVMVLNISTCQNLNYDPRDYYKEEIYVYMEVMVDSKCCSKNMFGFSMFQHPNKAKNVKSSGPYPVRAPNTTYPRGISSLYLTLIIIKIHFYK